MKILSIETSCDETAISIVEATGDFPDATYTVLGNALFSQIDIHREYGGVFPALAKREHAKTLVPMLTRALEESAFLHPRADTFNQEALTELHTILHRETGLCDMLIPFLEKYERPPIDLIAVTTGPGLEPALWVGINFARALSYAWNVPVVSINHMEGHVLSSVFATDRISHVAFPALALLISGGHTELNLITSWGTYSKIGETRDDAVGEAFDKVARMLGLPYPGGPEISSRAQRAREENLPQFLKLPRPMIDSDDFDFSFSGLKTAVRYGIEGKTLTENDVASIAREFEDSVTEVLVRKVDSAIRAHGIKTFIVGGGVSANSHIRSTFTGYMAEHHPEVTLFFPDKKLSTDNSIMIALAGHACANDAHPYTKLGDLRANGNLSLAPEASQQ